MSVYPWIPKEYYSTVMMVVGAYGKSQDEDYLDSLINLYSARAWVDRREVAKHVKARLAVERNIPRWFIVAKRLATDGSEPYYQCPRVMEGWSAEAVVEPYFNSDWKQNTNSDFFDCTYTHQSHEAIAEFDTKEEAESALSMWETFAEKYEWRENHRRLRR